MPSATPEEMLHLLVAEMERFAATAGNDPPEYWSARDAIFDLVADHPELSQQAADAGVPV